MQHAEDLSSSEEHAAFKFSLLHGDDDGGGCDDDSDSSDRWL